MCDGRVEGTEDGERCNREYIMPGTGDASEFCSGIILEHEVEDCACHINPPCAACTTERRYCSGCDWDPEDET